VDALKKLAASGIAVGVVIAPLLPGIDDEPEQIKVILETANSVAVESVDALPQHLPGSGQSELVDRLADDLVGTDEVAPCRWFNGVRCRTRRPTPPSSGCCWPARRRVTSVRSGS
jgi:hypothetical protein